MENKKIFLAILAVTLVLGIVFTSCGNGSTSTTGVVSAGLTTKVFESEDAVNRYILSFDAPRSVRAAYTPKYGDSYTLTIIVKASGETKTSSGTVLEVNGATLTLSGGSNLTVTIEVTSTGVSAMKAMTGTITTITGETIPAPTTLTPVIVAPNTITLNAQRWDSGEQWKYSKSLDEITDYKLKHGDMLTFKVSGTTDKTLEKASLSFEAFPADWNGYQWLGGSERVQLSGTFEKTFEIFIPENPNDGWNVGIMLANSVPVPASAKDWETLATITNFELRLIGVNLPGPDDIVFTTTLPVDYDTEITNLADARSRTDFTFNGWWDENDNFKTEPLFNIIRPPANVTVRNGNVTLNLGTAKWPNPDWFSDPGITKSPADLKCYDYSMLCTQDGKYILGINGTDDGNGNSVYVSTVYASKDAIVTGEFNENYTADNGFTTSYKYTYNMNLKKGWNYMISTSTVTPGLWSSTYTASTELPSGCKWTVYERN